MGGGPNFCSTITCARAKALSAPLDETSCSRATSAIPSSATKKSVAILVSVTSDVDARVRLLMLLRVASLPPDDRTLLTLQYLHDMPLQEIAEQMNWGLSKTKIKSFRAKRKLKEKLKIYGISRI